MTHPFFLAAPLAPDPVGLTFGERQAAGDRRAAGHGQPQTAVVGQTNHVAPRPAMARDRNRHEPIANRDLLRRLRRIGRQPGQTELHDISL